MAQRSVEVRTAAGDYEVLVEPGLLRRLGHMLRERTVAKQAAIVTDSTVGPLHGEALASSLKNAGFSVTTAVIPAGENQKTLATLGTIYDSLLAAKVERSSVVLALGGGVVGDTAGFAAATVLRGVSFVQVPTTLLAMVDASVGGKTGVNHAAGKNLIGAFHQPIAVFIDPETLATLPKAVLRDGLAECIKHDLIRDAEAFGQLTQTLPRVIALDPAVVTDFVAHNVAIKAAVVMADPFERGERAHLNLGHTFAHAIEKVTRFGVSHGSAVAMGLCAAGYTAWQAGMISQADYQLIVRTVETAGLPVRGLPGISADAILSAMAHDKKVEGGKIRLVLNDRIGHVVIRDDVPVEEIRRGIESIL